MTWSYTGNPASSSKDAIRFLVGDTVSTDALVTDEEIAWALTQNTNVNIAASIIAKGLATKFATMKVSVKIGPISEEYGNRAKFYSDRAKELEKTAYEGTTLNIYGGGISASDKAIQSSDYAGSFSKGMTDYTNENPISSASVEYAEDSVPDGGEF